MPASSQQRRTVKDDRCADESDTSRR